MQFDREKFKDAILYICSQCEPSMLGAVKLNKVLYYSDMIHYILDGAPLTGAAYRKRPFGPTCDAVLPALRTLSGTGALEIREVDYFGFRKKEYKALVAPNLARFNESELIILNEMIDFVCRNNTATTISDFSHTTPWEVVDFGDPLPYHGALHLIPNPVSSEAFDWAAREAPSIEATRSKTNPLDYPVLADLRERVLQASS